MPVNKGRRNARTRKNWIYETVYNKKLYQCMYSYKWMETINNKRNKNYFLKILNNSNTKQTQIIKNPS